MKITTEEIVKINKEAGGNLRNDSSLKFAESHCRNTNSSYKCAAIWIKAIVIDRPFTDGNKRTAIAVADNLIKFKNKRKLTKAIIHIAKKNTTNIQKIKETLENANR